MFRKFFIILIFLFPGCSGKQAKRNNPAVIGKEKQLIKLITYKEVPQTIRQFLDSTEGGHFSIADTGEIWDCCCTRMSELPSRKFVEAYRGEDFIRMKYLTGGFVTTEHYLLVKIAKGKMSLFQ
jgi:hypothetical protein